MRLIPRLRFAHLPTAVEALPRLSAALGGPRLLVKRDDQTGLAGGGNKARKLEFLLAEAEAHGSRTLITAGAIQSNHCRQTAAAAARYGYDCILVLAGAPPAAPTANYLLDLLFGAEIVWAAAGQGQAVLQKTFETAWQAGRRPYLIPYGGSNATGAAGYVFAMQELLDQADPDWIVLASSSGGTQAGLAVGARLFNYRGRLLGISIDAPAADLQACLAALATATADLLAEPLAFSAADFLVNSDYLGAGYGVFGEVERAAISLFAQHEGLLLDPVYTGRAAAGLVDLISQGTFAPDQQVLFWHTGGTPTLFADCYQ